MGRRKGSKNKRKYTRHGLTYARKVYSESMPDGFQVRFVFARRVPSAIFEYVRKKFIIDNALKLLKEINDQQDRRPE